MSKRRGSAHYSPSGTLVWHMLSCSQRSQGTTHRFLNLSPGREMLHFFWSKQVICQGWVQKGGYLHFSCRERHHFFWGGRTSFSLQLAKSRWHRPRAVCTYASLLITWNEPMRSMRPNHNRKAGRGSSGGLCSQVCHWTFSLEDTTMSILSLFFLQPARNGFLLLVTSSAQTKLFWKIRTWHIVSGRWGHDMLWAEMSKMTTNNQASLRVSDLIILISTSEQKVYTIYLTSSYEGKKSSCVKQSKSPSATEQVFIKSQSLFSPYFLIPSSCLPPG